MVLYTAVLVISITGARRVPRYLEGIACAVSWRTVTPSTVTNPTGSCTFIILLAVSLLQLPCRDTLEILKNEQPPLIYSLQHTLRASKFSELTRLHY